jgi:hypothetical protein
MKCRDPTIRRNAIRLLRSRPMRESTMGSALRTRPIEIQMEMEEVGAIGSEIPEEARIRGIKTKCNLAERRGTTSYLNIFWGGEAYFRNSICGLQMIVKLQKKKSQIEC